ncbi:MAG: AAA family ATPase [Acidobacteria bacterium]|nr:AAA family ATPase [Acidobacteriota bacterium]
MTPEQDFIDRGDGCYRLEVPGPGIVLSVDRLARHSGELIGELTVTCDLPGAKRVNGDGALLVGSLNFSSISARETRAKLLAKRSEASDYDWYGTLEYFCQRVVIAERTGASAVLLRDMPKPSPDATWTIHGLPVLKDHPEIIFGDGGACKSLIALARAGELAQRGVSVLYADWETSAGDHRARLESLFGADMPDVRYARCEAPLTVEVDRLRRLIVAHGIQYMILDSLAYGCDGPPEAAETANAYCRAMRQLRVGATMIAHINRSENGDQKPFGSAFWHNSARSTWFAKRSEADGNASDVTVALFHRKCNTGPLLAARGLQISFRGDRISIQPSNLTESEDFAGKLPLWQRMRGTLTSGPMTLTAMSTELDAKVETIERTVRRCSKLFTRQPGADGVTRIHLVERRAS